MQYLFPSFNYTSYKSKTSVSHLSYSLPTDGTLKPRPDPSSLTHPSPEVQSMIRMKDWEFWAMYHLGQQVSAVRPQPLRSRPCLLSGVLQSTVEKWWQEWNWAGRVAEKALPRGRIMVASPVCSGLLLGIACSSLAAVSYWPCVREQLPVLLCCLSVQDAEQKCKWCQSSSSSGWASTGTACPSAWPHWARES